MIPTKLRYGTKVDSAPARSYKSNVQPQNGIGPYGAGSVMYLNIPTRSNLFMASTENYLRFDFTCTNTNGGTVFPRWDSCGAHGLIQRIRVFHGSNMIEDIDNYGLLAKMLYDVQLNTDSAYGKMNILAGTRNDLFVDLSATNVTATFASATQANSGEAIGIIANGVNNGTLANGETSARRTYCLNLISIIGSLCSDKYFPLFACTSAPLRVEIWLVDSINKCMNINGTGTFALNNVELVTNMIEVSDDVMGIISNSLEGSPLQFVVPSYRNYGWSGNSLVDGTTTQINMPIPAKFSSVKSIFVCMRDNGTGANNRYPFSCVTLGTFIDYYFRVGSLIMPPKYPYSTTEAFAELMKAIGSISDLNHNPSIELASYTLPLSSAANNLVGKAGNNSGSFYVGLDLENYVGANKDAIFAGYNTNTDDIYFVYDITPTANINPRFDSYALYDNLLVFQNGSVFAKF